MYDVVQFYGNRKKQAPWDNPYAPRFIGNELRHCRYVGLGLSWPLPLPPWGCSQLHVFTAWGDERDSGDIPEGDNPVSLTITDSDDARHEQGDNLKTYSYAGGYNDPHPEGPGWYFFDYYMAPPNTIYIMNATTLSEADCNLPANCEAQKVAGSYRIRQDSLLSATGLHYFVGTDTDIYRVTTTIDEDGNYSIDPDPTTGPHWEFEVDWDLDSPVATGETVTIFTELVLCEYNAVEYRDVHFTYDSALLMRSPQINQPPSFKIAVTTGAAPDPDAPYVCGGHVVGAFQLYSDASRTTLLGEYRFEHEYNYDQDPENHSFLLESVDGTDCFIDSLRFGHSYGFLDMDALWEFENWIDGPGLIEHLAPDTAISKSLDWAGMLPYPCNLCLWPRTSVIRPQWTVYEFNLFQDTFSNDGTTTGTASADAAGDISPRGDYVVVPGDSAVVTCWDPVVGIAPDGDTGCGPAVYCYISVDGHPGGLTASAIEADDTRGLCELRFPHTTTTSAAGRTWHVYRMDSCFASDGELAADRYCINFNDDLFIPGDTCWFFFGAKNSDGMHSYYSEFTGASNDIERVATSPMEFQILPTGNPDTDILYVDDSDGGDVQEYFYVAFRQFGMEPDRYDVRGPYWFGSNGPGGRVTNVMNQLIRPYRKIIWNTGDLSHGLGDGASSPSDEDDWTMLFDFCNQHTSPSCGVYLSGDNLAQEWVGLTGGGALGFRTTFMNFNLTSGDHKLLGHVSSPLVVSEPGSIFDPPPSGPDTMLAYGSEPLPANDFDVLTPTGMTTCEMTYSATGQQSDAAVVLHTTTNLNDSLVTVILSGFSFHNIRDDRTHFVLDRVHHLYDIIRALGNPVDDPIGIGGTKQYTNDLAQNYPNPFNPTTTIEYSIKEQAWVTLRVYNVAGQLVKTLVDEELKPSQVRPVIWDCRNNAGQPIASGVYFYSIVTKNFAMTKKMVILK